MDRFTAENIREGRRAGMYKREKRERRDHPPL